MWQFWSLLSSWWSGWSLSARAGLALAWWWSDLLTGGGLSSRIAPIRPRATCVEAKVSDMLDGTRESMGAGQRGLASWDDCNPAAATLVAAVVAPRPVPTAPPVKSPPVKPAAEPFALAESGVQDDEEMTEGDSETPADSSPRARPEQDGSDRAASAGDGQPAALARLPRFYAQLDLQEEQRVAVLATQAKHVAQLAQLRQQLRDAERERDEALASHLTPAQLKKLRQLQRPQSK